MMLVGGVVGALGVMAGLGVEGMQPIAASMPDAPCGRASDRARDYFGGGEGASVTGEAAAGRGMAVCDPRAYHEGAFVPLRCRRAVPADAGVSQ